MGFIYGFGTAALGLDRVTTISLAWLIEVPHIGRR
jgi:hypothetical protein